MTPATPAETFRLWARKTIRSRWSLEAAGTREECEAAQQRLSWRGWTDFYLTQRLVDPNKEKFR